MAMPFHLFYQQGTQGKSRQKHESFSTEPQAVNRACTLMANGGFRDFHVEDEKSAVVTSDIQIEDRCKGA
jgi:hypothetical protein